MPGARDAVTCAWEVAEEVGALTVGEVLRRCAGATSRRAAGRAVKAEAERRGWKRWGLPAPGVRAYAAVWASDAVKAHARAGALA